MEIEKSVGGPYNKCDCYAVFLGEVEAAHITDVRSQCGHDPFCLGEKGEGAFSNMQT